MFKTIEDITEWQAGLLLLVLVLLIHPPKNNHVTLVFYGFAAEKTVFT